MQIKARLELGCTYRAINGLSVAGVAAEVDVSVIIRNIVGVVIGMSVFD